MLEQLDLTKCSDREPEWLTLLFLFLLKILHLLYGYFLMVIETIGFKDWPIRPLPNFLWQFVFFLKGFTSPFSDADHASFLFGFFYFPFLFVHINIMILQYKSQKMDRNHSTIIKSRSNRSLNEPGCNFFVDFAAGLWILKEFLNFLVVHFYAVEFFRDRHRF